MREKFARFMAGRYGGDELNRVISISSIVCLIASIIIRMKFNLIGSLLWAAGIALIVICYYRMFSKDIASRAAENQKFQTLRYRYAVEKQRKKERDAQKEDYKFFKCPKCKVLNRVPKGKGKIQITCPKCGKQFIRKS